MKIYSSRILPVALSAVLVLGACGGDDTASDAPIDTVGEQPGLRAPTPIEITGAGNATLGASAAEDAAASSDMMIAPAYWISEYAVGDGMPALPIDDLGYVFDASRAVTAERVAQIASALGVVGEPVHFVEEWGNSWRVGPDDGSAPSLWVSEDSQQSWNYNSAWQQREAVVGCAVAVDSDGNEFGDCPDPEPPVGVPTEAEAEQRARQLMTALGEDASALQFDTYGDQWGASVVFRDGTDSRATLREWSFGFGAEGVLDYAAGYLAQAEPVGPYPLIDIDAAVARLEDGGYGYGGYYGGSIEPGIAIAEAPPTDVAVDPAEGASAEPAVDVPEGDVAEQQTNPPDGSTEPVIVDDVIVEEPMPVEPMPVEPVPGEEMPEPETIVVTLVDVQADLWWAWDVDGSVWLLPAYRFIDADGGWHTVPAVTDEFMIEVEPPVFIDEPVPAPQPLPAPESLPVEPDVPEVVVDEPVDLGPEAEIVELNQILPLPLDEFIERAASLGFQTRVIARDGEELAVTADFSESRVNVEVEGEIVVHLRNVG